MEDLLNKHAGHIEAANAGMVDGARAAVEKANGEARKAIQVFGHEMLVATRAADDALVNLKDRLNAIVDGVQTDLAGGFIENVSALAASANSMAAEVRDRTTFLTTGQLPPVDPLPPVIPPVVLGGTQTMEITTVSGDVLEVTIVGAGGGGNDEDGSDAPTRSDGDDAIKHAAQWPRGAAPSP